MKIESVAIVLFALWFISEPLLLRTARDRGGSDVDARSLMLLATSNLVLPWLSIALYFLGVGRLPFSPWLKLAGVVIMVAGFCIRWSGMWTLRKFFSANVAVQSDHRLVIAGPYRFVRHPGYFGGWLGFVGLGLALGNGIAIVLLTLLTLPAFLYRIRVEENALAGAFPDYLHYASKVKRFVPFVW
ncbi:methyltransferase family protein [Dyella telluris]|uniref:Isoprenylcysteine carboxylmethyltransferase family protein n=1 Tax=Dyella telluris TaxID=2763498 RepID=A0A7G8Q8J8_9GAMM|nr:isoprenylcysteine carboxylmethyltransferase family protein [Dyella telluris]QNK03106.1 isoprenylcysteine carboxylmethyltransferase family protein [Dyella telluris]